MSIDNLSQSIGEAIIKQCERAGFKLWVDEGSAQVRVRDALCDPRSNDKDEIDRAASHAPRSLPGGLTSDLNNKRGSVLVALRIRAYEAKTAAAALDPLVVDVAPIAAALVTPVKGVINQPGFGDAPISRIPGNADLDPTVDIT